jgi:hypothetical protein
LRDIAEFDVAWGHKGLRIRQVLTVFSVFVLVGAAYWFQGLTLATLSLLPLLTLAWVFWPTMGYRMTFDGHYEYAHPDLRPDVIRTKDVVHTPRYGWVLYRRQWIVGCRETRLLISYEVLAQLCTPDLMCVERDLKTASTAIRRAVARLPTVNVSKYLPLSSKFVMQYTAEVACVMFMDLTTQMRKLDFGLSLAATL